MAPATQPFVGNILLLRALACNLTGQNCEVVASRAILHYKHSATIKTAAMSDTVLRVHYLELAHPPAPIPAHVGTERALAERLDLEEYLDLYRRVGGPLRWDQRLQMPRDELEALLQSGRIAIYVLRDASGHALGFCEFDRTGVPEFELKNFGLIPEAQGRRCIALGRPAAMADAAEGGPQHQPPFPPRAPFQHGRSSA